MNNQIIALQTINSEARADSRDLARALGNQHESLLSLFSDYAPEFSELGLFRFEIGEIAGRGRPTKYALLNEDQCYFLLTLVRNSELVAKLKLGLVKAFAQARCEAVASPVALALPTDPLELLALSLQGLQQHRQQITALESRADGLEHRLDNSPIRMYPDKEGRIKTLCQQFGRVHPKGYSGAYRAFYEALGFQGAPLARYDSLPACRFQEAVEWLQVQIRIFSAQRPLMSEASD